MLNGEAPPVEVVGAERNDELGGRELEFGECHSVGSAIRGDRRKWRLGIVAQMGRHSVAGEPLIDKRAERTAFVLIDKYRTGRALSLGVGELALQQLQCPLPGDGNKLSAFAHHRAAITVRIVEPLERRLTAATQRATIHRMIGIAFGLDGATVAGLDQQSAAGRALATGGGVIRRHAGHRIVRRRNVWNQLFNFFVVATGDRRHRAGHTKHFEEFAALDGSRDIGIFAQHYFGDVLTHAAIPSSGSWRNRTTLGGAADRAWLCQARSRRL